MTGIIDVIIFDYYNEYAIIFTMKLICYILRYLQEPFNLLLDGGDMIRS